MRIRACAVLHFRVFRALIEHSKVTMSVSGKRRQPSCGDCAESPPPSLPVSVPVKTVPNLFLPTLPMETAPNLLPPSPSRNNCLRQYCAYQWHAPPGQMLEKVEGFAVRIFPNVLVYLVGIVPIHSTFSFVATEENVYVIVLNVFGMFF